jgi:hypothetical protein
MSPIVTELLSALVRYGIVWALGLLLAHHVITEDQQHKFVQFFTDPTVLLSIAGALVTVGLALRSVVRARLKLLTALSTPAATSENTIDVLRKTEAPSLTTPKTDVPEKKE